MDHAQVWKRATEAQEALARAFAAIIIKTADEMTEAQAQEADELMREHPDWGYLDAAVNVIHKAGELSKGEVR